jgi:hypothetical protein
LASLFLFPVAGHLAMELPAHLPEGFLALEFLASLIKVLNLYTIIFLVARITEGP